MQLYNIFIVGNVVGIAEIGEVDKGWKIIGGMCSLLEIK